MVLYNVTVKVDHDIVEEWVNWMKSKHIPDVLETGMFSDSNLLRLVGMNEADGVTYAVQYFCDSFEDLDKYQKQYAAALQQEHAERYKDKFVAFRTVMETV